jgi:hypothetical protein
MSDPKDYALADAAIMSDAVPSRLPAEWVPEGSGVWIVVRLEPETGQWEAVVPEFSIAGMGVSRYEAVENALGLLVDYLALEAAEGRSFEQARRPISRGFKVRILAHVLRAILGDGPKPPRSDPFFRLPLRGGLVH